MPGFQNSLIVTLSHGYQYLLLRLSTMRKNKWEERNKSCLENISSLANLVSLLRLVLKEIRRLAPKRRGMVLSTGIKGGMEPAEEFLAGSLLHYPQPDHPTLQATSPTPPPSPPSPVQPQWNSKT